MLEGTNHQGTKALRRFKASSTDFQANIARMACQHEPIPAHVDDIARRIVNAAYQVHKALGPGLLESTYEACLCYELAKAQLAFRKQVPVPLVYDGLHLEVGYRLDILVEELIVVELKASNGWCPIYDAQMITYLKLSGKRLGFVINFHTALLKGGIRRFVV